jgi:excisionase family DNA binding protein
MKEVIQRGLTRREAAAYLGIGLTTFETKFVATGRVRARRYPGMRQDRFDRAELDAIIDGSLGTVPAIVPAKVSKYGLKYVSGGGLRRGSY